MTSISGLVLCAGAAQNTPVQGSAANNYGPAFYSTPLVTANSGSGANIDAPVSNQGTGDAPWDLNNAPVVESMGLGLSNGKDVTLNPTTTVYNAGQTSFATSNTTQPTEIAAPDLSAIVGDGGYSLGTVGPAAQLKLATKAQGGAQFEAAAPTAAVPAMTSGPANVFVESVDPVADNPKTVNAEF